jgi:hypothetical protein
LANTLVGFDSTGQNFVNVTPTTVYAGSGAQVSDNLASVAAGYGDALVAALAPGLGAVATNVGEVLGRTVHLFDYLSPTQRTQVLDRTTYPDVTAALQQAQAAVAPNALFYGSPAGKVILGACSLTLTNFVPLSGVHIEGSGKGATLIKQGSTTMPAINLNAYVTSTFTAHFSGSTMILDSVPTTALFPGLIIWSPGPLGNAMIQRVLSGTGGIGTVYQMSQVMGTVSTENVACSTGQQISTKMVDFQVIGATGATCAAVKAQAQDVFVVQDCLLDFLATNTYRALELVDGAANNVASNRFRAWSQGSTSTAFVTVGCYNIYEFEAVNCASGVALTDATLNGTFLKLVVDGACTFASPNTTIHNLATEGLWSFGTFTGTTSGAVLTLTSDVTGRILTGGIHTLFEAGATLAVTITALTSGVANKSGATYSLSGTPTAYTNQQMSSAAYQTAFVTTQSADTVFINPSLVSCDPRTCGVGFKIYSRPVLVNPVIGGTVWPALSFSFDSTAKATIINPYYMGTSKVESTTAAALLAVQTFVGDCTTVTRQTRFSSSNSYVSTATYTVDANLASVGLDYWIQCGYAGTMTLTLPAGAVWTGRELMVSTRVAQTVVSASSNVVPMNGAAGTAILAGTIGKWARLQYDGTNWNIIAYN